MVSPKSGNGQPLVAGKRRQPADPTKPDNRGNSIGALLSQKGIRTGRNCPVVVPLHKKPPSVHASLGRPVCIITEPRQHHHGNHTLYLLVLNSNGAGLPISLVRLEPGSRMRRRENSWLKTTKLAPESGQKKLTSLSKELEHVKSFGRPRSERCQNCLKLQAATTSPAFAPNTPHPTKADTIGT